MEKRIAVYKKRLAVKKIKEYIVLSILMMKKITLVLLFINFITQLTAQKLPCSNPVYRQFDFWIGEWEAFRGMDQCISTTRLALCRQKF